MKILIGADLVPTESNTTLFAEGNAEALVGTKLLEELRTADYRIFNLEVPLTNNTTPIAKCGPALIAPTATIEGYKALGVDLLTLGNNHILDQGVGGLRDTVSVLKENGISYVGAGENLQEAAKPFILESDGKRIGIYACSEHEFSIAEENAPGANPFDPLESLDHVMQLKTDCDYVIVLYHGGKEYYRYPSPNLQKVCRKLVEKGSDLVICQHSHCVGCEEKYQTGTIIYGQGNFLFDRKINDCWDTGLLVCLNDAMEVSYIPVVRNDNGVRLARADQANDILRAFGNRSMQIGNPEFVQEEYSRFAQSMLSRYLSTLSGVNSRSIILRAFNKLTGGKWQKRQLDRKYTEEKKLVVQNFVECEAHREVIIQGLKKH